MKFKLIKDYPGSPRIGTIVYLQDCEVYILNSCTSLPIKYETLIRYNEYWQPYPEYDEKWAKSLIQNLILISTYLRHKPELESKLIQYADELKYYFDNNL